MSREEDLCVISDLCQQVRDRDREIAHLRETLLLIGTNCENYTAPHSCWTAGRTPDALYGADSVCPHCLANRALYTSIVDISGINTNQPKPLTPSDWWDNAPWNYDMDAAPKDGTEVLLKDDTGFIAKSSFGIRTWTMNDNDYFIGAIAWLPLPEQK